MLKKISKCLVFIFVAIFSVILSVNVSKASSMDYNISSNNFSDDYTWIRFRYSPVSTTYCSSVKIGDDNSIFVVVPVDSGRYSVVYLDNFIEINWFLDNNAYTWDPDDTFFVDDGIAYLYDDPNGYFISWVNSSYYDYFYIYADPLTLRFTYEDYAIYDEDFSSLPAGFPNITNELSYQDGYLAGFNNGYNTGYYDSEIDHEDDYQNGYNAGFNFGYDEASESFNFSDLITSAIDVPINTIISLFNFEILGVNLQGLIFGIITIALVLGVIKFIL